MKFSVIIIFLSYDGKILDGELLLGKSSDKFICTVNTCTL